MLPLNFGTVGSCVSLGTASQAGQAELDSGKGTPVAGSVSRQKSWFIFGSSSVAAAESVNPGVTAHSSSCSAPLIRAEPALRTMVKELNPRKPNWKLFQSSQKNAPLKRR